MSVARAVSGSPEPPKPPERAIVNRQGTILKRCKCDNQQRCSHKWTLRYWADGRQRERSFADELDTQGRPKYGSGKRLARDWAVKIANDKRDQAYTDPKLGSARFGAECERWIEHLAGTESTKVQYRSILNVHVRPALGGRTLTSVAQARDDVADLLTVTMASLSLSRRTLARTLITGVLDEAVRAGKITKHRCAGIGLADDSPAKSNDAFAFASHAQLTALAGRISHGVAIWLMRGCGLRIQEALAVQKSCFREGGTVLHVYEQAAKNGRGTLPLKHRKADGYRDVPVPAYVWAMVKDLPDGYLFADKNGRLPLYSSFHKSFQRNAAQVGIPAGFTPHSLRHAFASALLARLVPITDVAKWLGHKDINVTFAIYGHLVPSAFGRALTMLNADYDEWSGGDRELRAAA